MATPQRGDEVVYRVWVDSAWTEYRALIRVAPTTRHGVVSLVFGDNRPLDDVPNIENWENDAALGMNSHWILSRVTRNDPEVIPTTTTIPAVGDAVWYNVWDGGKFNSNQAAVYAIRDRSYSPTIDLLYIDDSGVSVGQRNVQAPEAFKQDLDGNNHWVNRLPVQGDR